MKKEEVLEMLFDNWVGSSKEQFGFITNCYSFQDEKTKENIYLLGVKPQYGKELNFKFTNDEINSYWLNDKNLFKDLSWELFGKKVKVLNVKRVEFID